MKPAIRLFLLVIVSCAASQLIAQADTAPGGIRLLPGYVHHRNQGIDSTVGAITRNGGLTIKYDIGEMAGVYAKRGSFWTKGESWRQEQTVNGHRVLIVSTVSHRLVISFPEGNANFYATVHSRAELTDMLLMVLTFNPK
jgi:hypothetical protein